MEINLSSHDENEIEEASDTLTDIGFTKELIDEIRETKCANPDMFVSAWEEDDSGIHEKNMKDPMEQFLTAAEEGDLNTVMRMLNENRELISGRDGDGYTALHRAAYNNHIDVVSYLLQNGADPEGRTNEGWTALHSASNWGNYHIIGLLLSHGVDVNALSNGNVTALHLAINCQSDNPDNVFHSVRYLLQAPGVDASAVSGSGDTPLMLARRSSERIYDLLKDFLSR